MGSLIPNSLLSFVALLFGISVLVQALQELYKYLSNNKSRAYSIAMRDYMGALFSHILSTNIAQDIRVRGPFQVFRFRPKDHIMPLSWEQLQQALETTLPVWKKKLLDALRNEVALQMGKVTTPSPEWQHFIAELQKAGAMADLALSTADVTDFLQDWKQLPSPATTNEVDNTSTDSFLDAATLLTAFEQRFMGELKYYSDNYQHFNTAFEYQYKRRNMRLSFVIALLLTLCCNLPIQQVYKAAQGMNESQALGIISQFESFRKDIITKEDEDSVVAMAQATKAHTASPDTNSSSTASDTCHIKADSLAQAAFEKGVGERKEIISAMVDSLRSLDRGIGGLFDIQVPCAYVCRMVGGLPCCDSTKQSSLYSKEGNSSSGATFSSGGVRLLPLWLYILGCLVTALSVSFGAPILNNIADMIPRLKGSSTTKNEGGSNAKANA